MPINVFGSIRIDSAKLRHQDIDYEVIWCTGKLNPSDYLSRHPTKASTYYEEEAAEDAKLLYYLHDDTYYMKDITARRIQEGTQKDQQQR